MITLAGKASAIAKKESARKKSAMEESALAKKAYEFMAVMCQSEFEDIGHRLMDKSLKPSIYFKGDKAEYAGFGRVWYKVHHQRLPEYF